MVVGSVDAGILDGSCGGAYDSIDDKLGFRCDSVRLEVMDRVSEVMTWCARRLTLSRDLAHVSFLTGVEVAEGLKLLVEG